MNMIRILFAAPWVVRLGLTLLHFLWQGLAIAALYAGARTSAGGSSPHRRYLLACLALAAMLAAPIATYCLLGSPAPAAATASSATAAPPSPDSGTAFDVNTAGNFSMGAALGAVWSGRVLPSLVMLWLAGVLILWIRLLGGWAAAARLRTQRALPAPLEWQRALDRLKMRLRVAGPVRLLVSGLLEAPVVVGWLRPVVLVPIGALVRLPAEHLEALLLHELAHIRRHDYLVNLFQSIAEALLFYHPAVWWISGNIRAERELCCDDLAVAATGDAFTYAIALTRLESIRPVHARSAVAANGGRLASRIARLLGQTPEPTTFSAPGAASAILLAITACMLSGQPADRPKFEVASVKQNMDKVHQSAGMPRLPGGRLRAENLATSMLIMQAYHLHDFQVVGGPNWLRDVGFDIDAKGDPKATREQLMMMLQSLLEERFHLQYHRETRELPVYALVAVKSGSKLPAPKEGNCVKLGPDIFIAPSEVPCGSVNVSMSGSGMNAHGGDLSMTDFIRFLSETIGRPVLDRTGVTANFDLRLEFTVDEASGGMMKGWATVQGHRETMEAAAAAAAHDPHAPPNILGAVQEQLGLKLEATRGPAEVMVIDRVEKPTAN